MTDLSSELAPDVASDGTAEVAAELALQPRWRDDVTVELVKASAQDTDVVWAARVSTAGEQSIDAIGEDPARSAGLIRYLMRNRHGSPFEHNSMTFLISAPIFVFREFHRHRIGWCLTGDTEVTLETAPECGRALRRRTIADLYTRWHHGPARAVAVPALNEETQLFERARVVDIYETGVKEVMRFTTEDGKVLRCSGDHAVFTSDGWVKARDLDAQSEVAVAGMVTIGSSRDRAAVPVGVGAQTVGRRTVERAPLHRTSRRGTTAGSKFVRLARIEGVVGEEPTYDLEVEGPWHNFLANGVVVHNSYNEESARYRQLDPVFYVPGRERKLVQEGKAGAYVFVDGTDAQHDLVARATREACETAYRRYQEMLAAGVAREVARGVLPVATYSSMYATCNARSLMAFLSLRTRRDDSTFPSFPQREIEMVAERMEAHFATLMPITYAAFDANGRVSP